MSRVDYRTPSRSVTFSDAAPGGGSSSVSRGGGASRGALLDDDYSGPTSNFFGHDGGIGGGGGAARNSHAAGSFAAPTLASGGQLQHAPRAVAPSNFSAVGGGSFLGATSAAGGASLGSSGAFNSAGQMPAASGFGAASSFGRSAMNRGTLGDAIGAGRVSGAAYDLPNNNSSGPTADFRGSAAASSYAFAYASPPTPRDGGALGTSAFAASGFARGAGAGLPKTPADRGVTRDGIRERGARVSPRTGLNVGKVVMRETPRNNDCCSKTLRWLFTL
jgi:hypothetical protein